MIQSLLKNLIFNRLTILIKLSFHLFTFYSKIQSSSLFTEVKNIFIFGGLSLLFGFVNQIEGGMSNFKEIPLLIHLFYLKNPISIVFTSLISAIPITHKITLLDNFIIHFPSLLIGWLFYRYLIIRIDNHWGKAIFWMLVTGIYYIAALTPIWAFLSFESIHMEFLSAYLTGLRSLKFEIFATMFVTGLYLAQLDIRKTLEDNKLNLEKIVVKRTEQLGYLNNELLAANEELKANSEEILSVNENLDEMVKLRSRKIEDQLVVLNKYANMNSHEVRAPLARMLGLLFLINKEENYMVKNELLEKLNFCAEELDGIIKEMNRLLEKEI